jgi:hypothetical protein
MPRWSRLVLIAIDCNGSPLIPAWYASVESAFGAIRRFSTLLACAMGHCSEMRSSGLIQAITSELAAKPIRKVAPIWGSIRI